MLIKLACCYGYICLTSHVIVFQLYRVGRNQNNTRMKSPTHHKSFTNKTI